MKYNATDIDCASWILFKKTAVDISESQSECSYDPLRLVITSDIDRVLSNIFKLDVLLKERAKEKRILPTIANTYISISDTPRYSDEPFASILNASVFPNLLQNTDDDDIDTYLMNDLDMEFSPYEEFCNLLNSNLSDYSIKHKVTLAVLINSEFRYTSNKVIFPHLLVDSNGNNITDLSKVYPLPNEEQVIALPEWVDIKFLNPEMEKLLFKELQISNNRRELAQAMARYNLEEYSFDRLLRGVVNQVDEAITSKDKYIPLILWHFLTSEFNAKILQV